MAMLPGASVSGYYFWHPEARYFGLGRIGRDQLEDYARRKGWPSTEPSAGWRRTSPRTDRPEPPSGGPSYREAMRSGSIATLRRLLAGLVAASVLLTLAPASTAAAPGYTLDLGRRGDFVPQANFVQCVGASMQMMLNMIEPGRDCSARTQLRLQRIARSWSGPRPDGSPRQGASVAGWATGLNLEGAGPYRLAGREHTGRGAQDRREGDAPDGQAGRAAHVARAACLGHERVQGHGRPAPHR